MPPGPMPGVTAPPRRKRNGRPTLLTDELTAKIVKRITEEFAFFEMACVLEGIPAFTGRDWILRGKRAHRDGKAHLASEAVYARFSSAVEAARATLKGKFTAGILAHGKKDWKAVAWVAKAMFPQEFGGGQATAVVVDTEERQLEDGTVEETTTVSMQRQPGGDPDLTDEDYAEAAAFLLRRKRLKQAASRGVTSENG